MICCLVGNAVFSFEALALKSRNAAFDSPRDRAIRSQRSTSKSLSFDCGFSASEIQTFWSKYLQLREAALFSLDSDVKGFHVFWRRGAALTSVG